MRPATQKSVYREIKSIQYQYLAEEFKKWMETIGYKPQTIKLANWHILEFFSFLERQNISYLKEYKQDHLICYMDYLHHRTNCIRNGSLSAGYINKHISSLRLFSKYLHISKKAGLIIKPELLKTTETVSYLTKEEIKKIYKSAGEEKNKYKQRDIAMLSLFYGCGLRAGEGAALNIGDILFEKGLIYIRKGKNYRERYVPISREVKNDLKNYINGQRKELLNACPSSCGKNNTKATDESSQALLLSRRGNRWSVQGMYQRLQYLKNQTNDENLKQKTFGLHILRHSIATHLLQSGMKLEYISRFLGHKSLETTQKYTHLIKEENFHLRGS